MVSTSQSTYPRTTKCLSLGTPPHPSPSVPPASLCPSARSRELLLVVFFSVLACLRACSCVRACACTPEPAPLPNVKTIQLQTHSRARPCSHPLTLHSYHSLTRSMTQSITAGIASCVQRHVGRQQRGVQGAAVKVLGTQVDGFYIGVEVAGSGQWQHASPGHVGDVNIFTSQGEAFEDIVYRSYTISGAGTLVSCGGAALCPLLPLSLSSFRSSSSSSSSFSSFHPSSLIFSSSFHTALVTQSAHITAPRLFGHGA
jgi:hypothetical protein